MKCTVKYCGGCSPRFDRVARVRKLEAELCFRLEEARQNESYKYSM